jgi:transposase-like protein
MCWEQVTGIEPALSAWEDEPEVTSLRVNALLSAEADAVCGAEWGQASPDRVNRRNGYRHRDLDTRRMDKLVQSLGITSPSKSQVSRMAEDLDAQVAAFRTRPLDAGPYTFVAPTMKVREYGPAVKAMLHSVYDPRRRHRRRSHHRPPGPPRPGHRPSTATPTAPEPTATPPPASRNR